MRHLLHVVPLADARAQRIDALVPYALGVEHQALLVNVLAHHQRVAAAGLQHLAEGGRQENAALCIGPRFYVTKESHERILGVFKSRVQR